MFARKRTRTGCHNLSNANRNKQTELRVPLWNLSKVCSFEIMFEKKNEWLVPYFELRIGSLIKQTTLTKIFRVVLNNSNHQTVSQSIERFHGGTQWSSPDTNSLLQTWMEKIQLVAHSALVSQHYLKDEKSIHFKSQFRIFSNS